jgi:hypothetical protein
LGRRGLPGHHAVVAAVHHQDRDPDGRELGSGQRQVVHPALPRLGKHRPPGVADRRAEARPVPHLDQLVGDEPAVMREQADDLAHLLHSGGVAPHRVQARRKRHRYAHRAHQHDAAHHGRAGGRDRQGDRSAHRFADDVDGARAERVEQHQGVLGPGGAAVGALLSGGGAAEAELIWRDHAAVRAQRRDHRAPVCCGSDTRSGPVQQKHRRRCGSGRSDRVDDRGSDARDVELAGGPGGRGHGAALPVLADCS